VPLRRQLLPGSRVAPGALSLQKQVPSSDQQCSPCCPGRVCLWDLPFVQKGSLDLTLARPIADARSMLELTLTRSSAGECLTGAPR